MKATGGAFCALKGDGTVVTWGTLAFQEFGRLGATGVGECETSCFQMDLFSNIQPSWKGRDGTSFPIFFLGVYIIVLWNCNEKSTKKIGSKIK